MVQTIHAQQRLGQRGFNKEIVELILEYGSILYVGNGVNQYQILERDYRQIKCKTDKAKLHKNRDLIKKKAVLVADNRIITLINLTRKRVR